MKAACCEEFFACRWCHNAASHHEVDRYATKEMICMHCQKQQPAAQSCCACGEVLGKYYCDVCKYWSNDTAIEYFHCDKCGLCRVGSPNSYFHCDTCNMCLSSEGRDGHECLVDAFRSNCPVCLEDLFTSIRAVVTLQCRHVIHSKCLSEYIQTSATCPLCHKSLFACHEVWESLANAIEDHPMDEEYKDWSVRVLCNDCLERSVTGFHFWGHRCSNCGSFNTTETERFTTRETAMAAAALDMAKDKGDKEEP